MCITSDHIDHLREHGWVLVRDLLTPDELEQCRVDLRHYFPDPEKYAAAPERYRRLPTFISFPYAGTALNYASTHPEIISFVERILGTEEIQLGEALLQAKYAAGADEDPGGTSPDETMHVDGWGQNQIVYPRDDGIFRQIPMILYYTDVDLETGPTYVVSQQETQDRPLLPEPRDDNPISLSTFPRSDYPELYEREQVVEAPAGSLLIMSTRTFHRGSHVTATQGVRFVHFITYHAAAARWMRSQNWPFSAPRTDTTEMRRFIVQSTPKQRAVLGFPPPGNEYWNEETLAGVARRYPGIDLTPYRAAARFSAAV
jgi:hypothetical protein